MKKKSGGAKVKLAVVLTFAILTVGAAVALSQWSREKTVRFYSQAYFLLRGTEDNGFLGTDNLSAFAISEEGVALSLPDPNIDNKALEPRRDYVKSSVISLWNYEDNKTTLEMRSGEKSINLVGARTSLVVRNDLETGYDPITVAGPKYALTFDKLYPNEIIMIEQWWEIPASMADNLTLEDMAVTENSDSGPTTARLVAFPIKGISGYFFAGLYKTDDENNIVQVVEEFERSFETASSSGWVALSPV